MNNRKILIFGSTGMLGHALFEILSSYDNYDVSATVRDIQAIEKVIPEDLLKKVYSGIIAEKIETCENIILEVRPDVVINCIGLIKQSSSANDPLTAIPINSLFPHMLAALCRKAGVRMIHISTDCVFDGERGNYIEDDHPNATDLYGRTKLLGEVDYPPCLTLRTSIIGHELRGKHGLIEWFLSQKGKIKGYTRAIFNGFPTIEFARIIAEFVIPNPELHGLYHVSSNSISKYDLLKLVARRYNKTIEIEPYDNIRIDRSLDSTRFRNTTGYSPPSWDDLVDRMHDNYRGSKFYVK